MYETQIKILIVQSEFHSMATIYLDNQVVFFLKLCAQEYSLFTELLYQSFYILGLLNLNCCYLS